MKYLWDTHALIWGMENDPRLSAEARGLAKQPGNAISCISLWVVACLHHLKRITLAVPVEEWLAVASEQLQVIPVTAKIAATSLVCSLKLVTRDARLRQCRKLACVRA